MVLSYLVDEAIVGPSSRLAAVVVVCVVVWSTESILSSRQSDILVIL